MMRKTMLEYMQEREAVRAKGEAIGKAIGALCKTVVFIIILHFAWRFW